MTVHVKNMFFVIFVIIICFSCESSNNKRERNNSDTEIRIANTHQSVLHVYNMAGVPEGRMKTLLASLKSIYPHVQYDGKMPIYDDAYIRNSKKGKNRYWARTILQNMWDKHGDYKKGLRDKDGYLIITNTEICDRKTSGDHAVFGWSFRAVRLSVVSYRHFVSTKRCTDKDLLKIVMHELGHSYGGLLPGAPELRGHCPNLKCLMRDAKDKYPYTKINKFCASCDRVMKEKGFDTTCMQKLLN